MIVVWVRESVSLSLSRVLFKLSGNFEDSFGIAFFVDYFFLPPKVGFFETKGFSAAIVLTDSLSLYITKGLNCF